MLETEKLAERPRGRPRIIFKKRENNRGMGKKPCHDRMEACELQLVWQLIELRKNEGGEKGFQIYKMYM